MKILVTGDWHPDVVTLGVPRFEEVERAVEATVDAAVAEEVDVYCFVGDLANPNSGAATMRATTLALETALALARESIVSIWLSGNHDVFEDGSGTTTLTPMRALEANEERIFVVEQPRVLPIRGISFVCLPFVCAGQAVDVARFARESWPKGRAVVLGHMTHIPGVGFGSETNDMPRGRSVPFPVAETARAVARFNGHFHARQVSPDGIVMPGTLARLRFDEERHNPGYVLAEV